MAQQAKLVWNTGPDPVSQLGQISRQQSKQLTTIEKISIIGITVSLASLAWNIYTYSDRRKNC